MPYTLAMGLVWVLLAVLLGIVVGWLLRSVGARRQVERARAAQLDHADRAELEQLRVRVADHEALVSERDRLRAELEHERRRSDRTGEPGGSPTAGPADDASGPDLATGGAILGRPVERDDLTVVEGIGTDVAGLCHGIGIVTWADLAATEVSLLRTMLNDAGPAFADHDPSTWPEQAGLLAAGAWTEFRELTDRLHGGHPVD